MSAIARSPFRERGRALRGVSASPARSRLDAPSFIYASQSLDERGGPDEDDLALSAKQPDGSLVMRCMQRFTLGILLFWLVATGLGIWV